MLFLDLKKVRMVKITPPILRIDFHHPIKNFTPRKISITHQDGEFPLLLQANLENLVVCKSHYKFKIDYLVYLSVRVESLCIMWEFILLASSSAKISILKVITD